MESFVCNHADQIIGIICRFDRLVFRGFLGSLSYVEGMMKYMAVAGVLLKDFASHAVSVTKRLKNGADQCPHSDLVPLQHSDLQMVAKGSLAR
jgi:hypothetical protein